MRLHLLPLALLFAAPIPAAPVPKEKPRDGVIMVAINRQPTVIRLYKPDGTLISERSVENVCDCSLSPDGKRVAVCAQDLSTKETKFHVYVVDVAAEGKELGESLTGGFHHPRTAWSPDGGTLYVSNNEPPPPGSFQLKPGKVTVCDVAKRTAEVNESLQGHIVIGVSPDGRRLFTGREDGPKREWRNELLDRRTLKPVDTAVEGVRFVNLLDDDTFVGIRSKPGGPANISEWVFVSVTTKKVTPVPLPKELTGETASIYRIYPAPDGRRMLMLWSEEVDKPADWQGNEPCRPRRVTVCDRDGTNAKTLLRPDVKSMSDYYDTQFGWVDWR